MSHRAGAARQSWRITRAASRSRVVQRLLNTLDMRVLTLASCSLLSLPLVACTSTSSSTVSNDEYDDVAQNVGTATASPSGGDMHAMSDVVLVAGGTLPLGFSQSTEG